MKAIFRLNGISTPDIKKGDAKEFGNQVKKILK